MHGYCARVLPETLNVVYVIGLDTDIKLIFVVLSCRKCMFIEITIHYLIIHLVQ